MSALNNNTTINSELFAPLVVQAEYAAYETSLARQLVSVYDMPVGSGKVVQVPRWASITAASVEEGNAAAFADTNTTSASITLSEISSAHRVSDMLRDSSASNVLTDLGTQMGQAIGEAIDAQVFATFSGFDELVGTANAAITTDTILKGVATLRARKLTGPFMCVLHPAQSYQIKKQLTYAGANTPALSGAGESVLNAGYLGTIAGVAIYESSLLTVSGGGDATGAIFAKPAIGHAMRGGIAMEAQRQAAYRATDIVLTAVTGATRLVDSYGVKITSDASFGTL